MEQEVMRYENKIKGCSSMTDLLMTMASWQAFCNRAAGSLTPEQISRVDNAYIQAEEKLITQVKPSLW